MMPHGMTVATLLVVLPVAAFALQPGDTRDAVIAELGTPHGSLAAGDRMMMYYDRGTVLLHRDRVAAVNLVSAADLAAREAKEAAAIQRMDDAAQTRRARLEAEGNAILVAKKADASFAALPADTQFGYWRQFATRFPMISVDREIAPLAERINQETRLREIEAANRARLAALEERLAESEERADRAENETRYRRYDRYGGGYSFLFDGPGNRFNSGHSFRRQRDDCAPPNSSRACPPVKSSTHPVAAAPIQAYLNVDDAQRRAFKMRTN